jgi:hypothetical protein
MKHFLEVDNELSSYPTVRFGTNSTTKIISVKVCEVLTKPKLH